MENVHTTGTCTFYVQRKKRYCKMTVKEGRQFCGEHCSNCSDIPESTGKNCKEFIRMCCPYDSKHTCYVKQLTNHLKKCNARPTDQPAYIVHGINGSICSNESNDKILVLAQISDATLLELITNINEVSKDLLPAVSEEMLQHPVLLEELDKSGYGASTRKHLLQNSSLLGHLKKRGLLRDKSCFIEFGAGRGQLSYWLAQVESLRESMLLLVDRASHRHKFDNRRRPTASPEVVRIRADIADLCLHKIARLHDFENVSVLTKHLCGIATDLALKCIVASMEETAENKLSIAGMVIAFCCHHRCDWNTFVGKNFLLDKGFTQFDFKIMCGIASWATCGSGRGLLKSNDLPIENDNSAMPKNPIEGANRNRYIQLNLSPEERKNIGRRCKLILDYGRLKYLEHKGFNADLLCYVSEEISPENVCIVAHKGNV